MPDVLEPLSALGRTGAPEPADPGVVAADVARGRQALLRRRRRIAGAGLAGVAVVAAVTAGSVQFGQSGRSGSDGQAGAAVQQPAGPRLVAYTGAQPAGFRVSTVPAGWQVISSTQYAFLAVPPGAGSSTSPDGVVSFRNGIAVMLQGDSQLPDDEVVTKVTVNGAPGSLGLTRDKQATWLVYTTGRGGKVLVRVPTGLGLTDDQIVRFAAGITVTGDALPAGG